MHVRVKKRSEVSCLNHKKDKVLARTNYSFEKRQKELAKKKKKEEKRLRKLEKKNIAAGKNEDFPQQED